MITTLSHAMSFARKKFTPDEQKFLIDIYNGTLLTPHLLGRTMLGQVEDSFNLYPGYYEEKWGVNKEELLEKIKSLDTLTSALVELWAVGFWKCQGSGEVSLEDYLAGKVTIATRFREALELLENAVDLMEKSKSAFHSKTIAQARESVEKVIEVLEEFL